jgi:hypothetical protein
MVHSLRLRMEHQLCAIAPLRELIRQYVIQEGTCGNFQPTTYYPTRFLLKDKKP